MLRMVMVKKGRIFRSRIELTVAHCKNLEYACTLGWSSDIFLISQNRSSSQRSGMILEVQIQISGARRPPAHARQSYHFQKTPGGPHMNILL